MITFMVPASTLAAGSVGRVETQYLDLPEPVRLDCGRELHPIRVAYETYGTLSPRRDNVILVCHALSGVFEKPAAWASPLSAWHTKITLSRRGERVP